LHLTTRHAPLDTRIFYKECCTLAAAGHDVMLAAPDAIEGMQDGVRLHRLWPSERGPRPLRIAARLLEARRAATALRPQVVHFHDPELIPVGLALRAHGMRVVYDVHEDTPREARTVLADASFRRAVYPFVWTALEAATKTRLDGFVCATPTIAAGFPADRTVLVRNFPRLEEFATARARPAGVHRGGGHDIVYVGGLTEQRGVREMLDALARLPANPAPRLVLVGDFRPPDLGQALAKHPGWARVEWRGFQTREGVAAALSTARVGLVLVHPTPEHRMSYPVKLFEYMAAGLPVIASDFPLWREFVHDTGAGLLVDPLNPLAIAEAIGRLLADPAEAEAMGSRGAAAVRAQYDWEPEGEKLVRFYAQLEAR
jgi:glycosyltransferase involved in cell wall biosynthesis